MIPIDVLAERVSCDTTDDCTDRAAHDSASDSATDQASVLAWRHIPTILVAILGIRSVSIARDRAGFHSIDRDIAVVVVATIGIESRTRIDSAVIVIVVSSEAGIRAH